MQLKLRHNTLMRLTSGSVLILGIPGILFLGLWWLQSWQIGLIVALAFVLMVAYGFFLGWRHIVVKTAVCKSKLLPKEMDGYRILQLSDIHIGTYLRNRAFIA